MISSIFWIVPVSALMALLFAWIFYRSMKAQEEGTDKMKEIALYVREGATFTKTPVFCGRQVFVILVILLGHVAYFKFRILCSCRIPWEDSFQVFAVTLE
jgi:K(+)-stimulated pyrophosphate-energized sodium pump